MWKAYRFAYEYDFITTNCGFVGFILEAKYTDVTATLKSPIDEEFIHAKAPMPAIGGIGRVYVVPNISITGELTGVKIPDSISKEYKAHYADLDIYGTLNFTNNIGVQGGYRSVDVGYHVRQRHRFVRVEGHLLRGRRSILTASRHRESGTFRIRNSEFRRAAALSSLVLNS